MKTITAIEIEPEDLDGGEQQERMLVAIAHVDIVTYGGEVVKNRNGGITKTLSATLAEERRAA